MAKAGRPTDYDEAYSDQAYKLCLLGAVDSELADFFAVTEQTINNWKKDHNGFFESIKKGKDIANANVAASMYQKAVGYSHKEDKIFNNNGEAMIVSTTKHYPPDTQAGSLFLRNRTSVKGAIGINWRDKTEQEVVSNVHITDLSEQELDRKLQQLENELEQSEKT
jgi:hypothetical protein